MTIELGATLMTIDGGELPAAMIEWLVAHQGDVLKAFVRDARLHVRAIGTDAEVRRRPINITSLAKPPLALISNLAHTPFELDGLDYASVEGFWQGLKFGEEADRIRITAMHGLAAKEAGRGAPRGAVIRYGGEPIRTGTWEHWRLMERACRAKFAQHEAARAALLGTGGLLLTHRIGRDSKTIPGVIMAAIWMRIRDRLLRPTAGASAPDDDPPTEEARWDDMAWVAAK